MQFGILGPIEVIGDDGSPLALGGAKQRTLLAILLLRADEVVSADSLLFSLWGDEPPTTARNALQVYVSHLRKILQSGRRRDTVTDVIETVAPGYRLTFGRDVVDAHRFRRLVTDGQRALGDGRPSEASVRLREALSLWRGPALADVALEDFAQPEATALEELRLVALEDRCEADLEIGRASELVPELEAAYAEHPTRERLLQHLMLALYRSGRQADALSKYLGAVDRLVEEYGIDPDAATTALYQQILQQDAGLVAPPAAAVSETPTSDAERPSLPGLALTPVDDALVSVVALACRLRGMADMERSMTSEEVRLVTQECRSRIAAEIDQRSGTAVEVADDLVVGYFPVTASQGDVDDHAAAAASRIAETLAEISDEVGKAWGVVGITGGVGVAAGRALIGAPPAVLAGGPADVAVSLADRAPAATVLLEGAVARRSEWRFVLEPVVSEEADGSSAPMRLVAIREERPAPPAIPLVGRDRETEELAVVARDLSETRGGILLLSGEAGTGKTRLLAELRSSLDEDIQWLEGRCSTVGTSRERRPFRSLVRDWVAASDAEPELSVRTRIRARLGAEGQADVELVAEVCRLAGVRPSGVERSVTPGHGSDAGQLMRDAFVTWARLVTSQHPVVIAVENVHAADQVTRRAVEDVMQLTEGSPLLLVVTGRPGGSPEAGAVWETAMRGSYRRVRSIELAPLDDEASAELLDALAPAGAIDDVTRTEVLRRAGGNPFYLEQLTRTLGETDGFERRDGTVTLTAMGRSLPPTLEGVLLQRLSALPSPSRDLVYLAAVIGRQVSLSLLTEIAGPDVTRHLDLLVSNEILHEIAGPPDPILRFSNELLREAALASLSPERMASLHGEVAAGIRAAFRSSLDEHLEGLSLHEYLNGDVAAALETLEAAVLRAVEIDDGQAAGLARRGIRIATAAGDPAAVARFELLSG